MVKKYRELSVEQWRRVCDPNVLLQTPRGIETNEHRELLIVQKM